MIEIVNGWHLYQHPLFKKQLTQLKDDVIKLKEKDPVNYRSHPTSKRLASIVDSIRRNVPTDPTHKDFLLGNTLGKGKGHWRRVKKGLPNRYRLFFRFSSHPPIIVYVWINDDSTLRKDSAKTDCYQVFKKMLQKGIIPDSIGQLISEADTRIDSERFK